VPGLASPETRSSRSRADGRWSSDRVGPPRRKGSPREAGHWLRRNAAVLVSTASCWSRGRSSARSRRPPHPASPFAILERRCPPIRKARLPFAGDPAGGGPRFLLAVLAGIPLGVLIVSSPVLERLLYPLLVALQAIPKVALAPILSSGSARPHFRR